MYVTISRSMARGRSPMPSSSEGSYMTSRRVRRPNFENPRIRVCFLLLPRHLQVYQSTGCAEGGRCMCVQASYSAQCVAPSLPTALCFGLGRSSQVCPTNPEELSWGQSQCHQIDHIGRERAPGRLACPAPASVYMSSILICFLTPNPQVGWCSSTRMTRTSPARSRRGWT